MSFKRKKVLRALAKRGFVVIREGAGHTIVRDASGRQIAVPRHPELHRLTVKGMAEDAGVSWNQFRSDIS